jgi:hypothetical protein
VIADLPSWVDVEFLHQLSGTLVVVALLLVVVLMFVLRSLATKLVLILMVAAAVFGLVHYRQTLEKCGPGGCSCVLFGQKVHAPNCPDN